MADHAAVNASPLIFLARAGLLDLLQLAAPEVVVPAPAIVDDLAARRCADRALRLVGE